MPSDFHYIAKNERHCPQNCRPLKKLNCGIKHETFVQFGNLIVEAKYAPSLFSYRNLAAALVYTENNSTTSSDKR